MTKLRSLRLLLGLLTFLLMGVQLSAAQDRPNIVWILSEDNSVHYLRLYGAELGVMPTVERLASEGLTFEHAFSCAPVCSVARTTLMTGCYAPRIGFQNHRRLKPAELPDGAELFPAYLRRAGYHTTNNSKEDYNVVKGTEWDDSSRKATWRSRPTPETPFFHMRTTTVSHEGSLHFKAELMQSEQPTANLASVELPPYFPDTPTFRYTLARYFDRMRSVDEQVAQLVQELKDDQVLDNTIVFYFGDHGGVLPRSKGYLYETGLHVPLVVWMPEKWKSKSPFKAGTRPEGFVEFVDFGPTVLNLAGVTVPESMDGRPFLGSGVQADDVNQRDEAFGYADRFDEKIDFSRSLRKGKYKYIRNYQPFYSDALQNNYRYIMLAYTEWRELYHAGKLNDVQKSFFEFHPAEMLFDVELDPHEIHNLAGDPQHRETLLDLRKRLRERVESLPDLSFYPESELVDHVLPHAAEFGQQHREEIQRLSAIAQLELVPFAKAKPHIEAALMSDNRWERYWAATVCASFGEVARSLTEQVRPLLKDSEPIVRVRAAEFFGTLGLPVAKSTLLDVLATTDSPAVALLTLNSVVALRDGPQHVGFAPTELKVKARGGEVDRRLQYLGLNVDTEKRKSK